MYSFILFSKARITRTINTKQTSIELDVSFMRKKCKFKQHHFEHETNSKGQSTLKKTSKSSFQSNNF